MFHSVSVLFYWFLLFILIRSEELSVLDAKSYMTIIHTPTGQYPVAFFDIYFNKPLFFSSSSKSKNFRIPILELNKLVGSKPEINRRILYNIVTLQCVDQASNTIILHSYPSNNNITYSWVMPRPTKSWDMSFFSEKKESLSTQQEYNILQVIRDHTITNSHNHLSNVYRFLTIDLNILSPNSEGKRDIDFSKCVATFSSSNEKNNNLYAEQLVYLSDNKGIPYSHPIPINFESKQDNIYLDYSPTIFLRVSEKEKAKFPFLNVLIQSLTDQIAGKMVTDITDYVLGKIAGDVFPNVVTGLAGPSPVAGGKPSKVPEPPKGGEPTKDGKITVQLIEELIKTLTPELTVSLTEEISNYAVSELFPVLIQDLSPFLTEHLSTSITKTLLQALPLTLNETIPPLVDRLIPPIVIHNVLNGLGGSVSKGIEHALGNTLLFTLSYSVEQRLYCYYCKTLKKDCYKCKYPNLESNYFYLMYYFDNEVAYISDYYTKAPSY